MKEQMKAITFDSEINKESIKQLLLDIDKIPETENIILYMSSNGGSVSDKLNLVDYINRFPDRFTIVCNWDMSSAAFDLLLEVKNCKVKVSNIAFSRLHYFNNTIDIRNLNNNFSIDHYLLNDLQTRNALFIENFSRYLSDEEVEEIKKGNDIIINSNRMKIIINLLNPGVLI